MIKLVSVFLAVILLISIMHLTVANHYCGGELAASKISLSGTKASCGMEEEESSCDEPAAKIHSHCCDDEVSVFAIESNYTPGISDLQNVAQKVLKVFHLPSNINLYSYVHSSSPLADNKPPGWLSASEVSLVRICVFRN